MASTIIAVGLVSVSEIPEQSLPYEQLIVEVIEEVKTEVEQENKIEKQKITEKKIIDEEVKILNQEIQNLKNLKIKEQNERIETLEKQIEELESYFRIGGNIQTPVIEVVDWEESKIEYLERLKKLYAGVIEEDKKIQAEDLRIQAEDLRIQAEEARRQAEEAQNVIRYYKSREELPEQEEVLEKQIEEYKVLIKAKEETQTKYATVIKLTDSKGNTQFLSEYNNKDHVWTSPYPVLNAGETLTISVDVNNNIADPVLYQFNGIGFPNIWQKENWVKVTIDNNIFNLETIHLRVFIKNSDDQYRAPHYDDMIQVFYKKR
jgi:hypothetical protein